MEQQVVRLDAGNGLAVDDVVDGSVQDEQTSQIVTGFILQAHSNRRLRDEANGEGRDMMPLPREVVAAGGRETRYTHFGTRLADMCDEFDSLYGRRIENMVNHDYNIGEETTVAEIGEMFMGTANGLFANGITSTKITMLLNIGFELISKILQRCLGANILNIIGIVVRFMLKVPLVTNQETRETQTITQWVASQGGWIDVLSATRNEARKQVARVGLLSWEMAGFVGVNLVMVFGMWYRRRL